MAIALGIEAAKARKRVLFHTAESLTNELVAAEVTNRLPVLLDTPGMGFVYVKKLEKAATYIPKEVLEKIRKKRGVHV